MVTWIGKTGKSCRQRLYLLWDENEVQSFCRSFSLLPFTFLGSFSFRSLLSPLFIPGSMILFSSHILFAPKDTRELRAKRIKEEVWIPEEVKRGNKRSFLVRDTKLEKRGISSQSDSWHLFGMIIQTRRRERQEAWTCSKGGAREFIAFSMRTPHVTNNCIILQSRGDWKRFWRENLKWNEIELFRICFGYDLLVFNYYIQNTIWPPGAFIPNRSAIFTAPVTKVRGKEGTAMLVYSSANWCIHTVL